MKTTFLLVMMALAVTADAAMARPMGPISYGQSIYCATREAGNPHSRICDYLA